MSLVKWTPLLSPSFDEFDRFFDGWPLTPANMTPALDVYQDADTVIVEAPIAGINPEEVEISIENDVLTIKGETKKQTEIDEQHYYRKEIRRGNFYRAVQLPTRVMGDNAEAAYDKGVLTIRIPKAPEAKPKTIKVTSK